VACKGVHARSAARLRYIVELDTDAGGVESDHKNAISRKRY